jgi:hypothetical protein
MKLLQRHKGQQSKPMPGSPAPGEMVDSEGGGFYAESHPPLIDVAPYTSDSRYRLVRLAGHTEPLAREEFVPRVHQLYPGLDLDDAEKVHWADRPWEWPRWHPGEA